MGTRSTVNYRAQTDNGKEIPKILAHKCILPFAIRLAFRELSAGIDKNEIIIERAIIQFVLAYLAPPRCGKMNHLLAWRRWKRSRPPLRVSRSR